MKNKIINILFICAVFYIGFEVGTLTTQVKHKKQLVEQMQANDALNDIKKAQTEQKAEELEEKLDQLETIKKGAQNVRDNTQSAQKIGRNDDVFRINHSTFSLFIKQNAEYEKLLSSESAQRMQ